MVKYIPIMISAAVLIYGGVVDFRKREIPNAVPIVLLTAGCFFAISPVEHILGLIAPAAMMFAAVKLTGSDVPGGDFKLLCTLGFACGLLQLAAILFLAGIGAIGYGFLMHLPVKRHIPLCSYIAPAYGVFQLITISVNC